MLCSGIWPIKKLYHRNLLLTYSDWPRIRLLCPQRGFKHPEQVLLSCIHLCGLFSFCTFLMFPFKKLTMSLEINKGNNHLCKKHKSGTFSFVRWTHKSKDRCKNSFSKQTHTQRHQFFSISQNFSVGHLYNILKALFTPNCTAAPWNIDIQYVRFLITCLMITTLIRRREARKMTVREDLRKKCQKLQITGQKITDKEEPSGEEDGHAVVAETLKSKEEKSSWFSFLHQRIKVGFQLNPISGRLQVLQGVKYPVQTISNPALNCSWRSLL